MILTFLTLMSQTIANLFSGEWEIILVLNIIVGLSWVVLFAGLFIELRQGKNGVTRGLYHVVGAVLHQQLFSIVGTAYIIQGKPVESLGDWRLFSILHILAAIAYSIFEVIRHVVQRAHENNETD